MIRRSVVLLFAYFAATSTSLLAQPFTFTPLPAQASIMNQNFQQVAGCSCYIPNSYPPGSYPWKLLNTIQVSPTRVVTTVGQPVQIRYDASAMCMGQTTRDKNGIESGKNPGPFGTATWEVGSVQNLPDLYGQIAYSGYQQPISTSITINLNPQCYDTGAKCRMPNKYSQCSASITIPVDVFPVNTPVAELQKFETDVKANRNDAFFKPEERTSAIENNKKVMDEQKKNVAKRRKANSEQKKK